MKLTEYHLNIGVRYIDVHPFPLKLKFVPPSPEKGSIISCNVRTDLTTSPNCQFAVYIQAR